MKRIQSTKVLSVFSILILLFTTFLFPITSCNNVFSNPLENLTDENTNPEADQNDIASQSSGRKYASISGSITLDGAYPEAIKNDIEKNRAALPSLPAGYSYYITATYEGGEPINGVIAADKTYKFEKLEIGVKYTFEAGIKGDYGNGEGVQVFMNDFWPNVEFTASEPSKEHRFILKPVVTSGTGHVSLSMSLPASGKVKAVRIECASEDASIKAKWNSITPAPAVSLNGNTATLEISSIPSGSYAVRLIFLNDNSDNVFPLYSTIQTINVFKNMITNAWAEGGNSGVISGSSFNLTDDLFTAYSISQLYVGTFVEGYEPSEHGEGTPYSPLQSFSSAIEKIKAQKIASNAYTIHISGTQTGNFELNSDLIKSGDNANAASITIEGHTVTIGGEQKAPILSGGNNGTVLSVETNVPVALKNITVSGGLKSAGNGAGIRIANGASVTLDSGTVISENTAKDGGHGGAVYVAPTGSLTIKSNASIPYGNAEGKNDIYLDKSDTVQAAVIVEGNLSGDGVVATLTPAVWARGTEVLKAAQEEDLVNALNRFSISDTDFYIDRSSPTSLFGMIKADIYVAASDTTRTVCTAPDSTESNQRGTKSSPYSSMTKALTQLTDSSYDYEIKIDGVITGDNARINISGDTLLAQSLHLSGAIKDSNDNQQNALIPDANLSSASGPVIKLDKNGLVVTITDLKISGGYGSSSNKGGGINITDGTVKLGNGAIIAGNTTSGDGAGVYVDTNGTLFMYGNSLIGDKTESLAQCQWSTYYAIVRSGKSANEAHGDGGGIYNKGKVYIGYSGIENSTLVESPMGDGYGVRRNSATGYRVFGNNPFSNGLGGGIYSGSSATLNIASGTFSYNLGRLGGALYVAGTNNEICGTTKVEHNQATSGGAIYLSNNTTLPLSGDITVTNNNAGVADGDEGTVNYLGGSIYINSTASVLEMKDKVYIPSTGEKQNDIYLSNGRQIRITGAISLPDGKTGANAVITPSAWIRGTQVLDGSTTNLLINNASRFAIIDNDWTILTTSEVYAGDIDAPIYVAGSNSVTVNSTTYGAGSTIANGGRGSKSKPYLTIEEAVAQCWKGPNDTRTSGSGANAVTIGREINIVGTVNGGQKIPSAINTTSNATKITLQGINSDAILNGGYNSESIGTTLKIECAVPVDIKTLKITGGYNNSTSEAAGLAIINDSNTGVTLGEDVQIYGNTNSNSDGSAFGGGVSSTAPLTIDGASIKENTADNAGGVYINSSILVMKSGSISNNSSTYSGDEETVHGGGGVFINGGTFYFSGGSISDNTSGRDGGGLFLNGAALYMTGNAVIGYHGATALTSYATSEEGKHSNKADKKGGGIFSTGASVVAMGYSAWNATNGTGTLADSFTGGVRYNLSADQGGGIFDESTGGVHIAKNGFISFNTSTGGEGTKKRGGGVYNSTNMTIEGDAVLEKNRAYSGGSIYNTGTLTMSSGMINGCHEGNNTASSATWGGAIYNAGDFTMSGGTIKNHISTIYGGAIYNNLSNNNNFIRLVGGSIVNNSTNSIAGGAIYSKKGNIQIGGSISIPADGIELENDIYLDSNYKVRLIKDPVTEQTALTGTGIIWLSGSDYYFYASGSEGAVVVNDEESGALVKENYTKFGIISSNIDGVKNDWTLTKTGKTKMAYKITSSMIETLTVDSIPTTNIVIGPDVTQDQFNSFMDKIFGVGASQIMEGHDVTLDLSKATKLTKLGVPSSTSYDRTSQKFDTIILPINLSANYWTSNDSLNDHFYLKNVKKLIAVPGSKFYSDSDGIVYSADKKSLVYFPGSSEETSFITPEGVTSIGKDAFSYLQSELDIVISSDVTALGANVFFNAGKLKSVVIQGTPTFGDLVFCGCSSLTKVTFPGTPTTGFNVPAYWTEIPYGTFRYCSKMKNEGVGLHFMNASGWKIGSTSGNACNFSSTDDIANATKYLGSADYYNKKLVRQ